MCPRIGIAVGVRRQIQEIGAKSPWPDDIDQKDIRWIGREAQQLGCLCQLLRGASPSRNQVHPDRSGASEIVEGIALELQAGFRPQAYQGERWLQRARPAACRE